MKKRVSLNLKRFCFVSSSQKNLKKAVDAKETNFKTGGTYVESKIVDKITENEFTPRKTHSYIDNVCSDDLNIFDNKSGAVLQAIEFYHVS